MDAMVQSVLEYGLEFLKFLEALSTSPIAVGFLGAFAMTQAYKWTVPTKFLQDWTDHYRATRIRLVAIVSGMAWTILGYMSPANAAEGVQMFTLLGITVALPPLKALLIAPVVGIFSVPLWDILMYRIETKYPNFYKKYISGSVQRFQIDLPIDVGDVGVLALQVVTDSKGRFIKLKKMTRGEGDSEGKTLVLGKPPMQPKDYV